MPIKWHEECAKAQRGAAEKENDRLIIAQRKNDLDYKKVWEYEEQIRVARAEHRDGFDADKYLKRRPVKECNPYRPKMIDNGGPL